MGGKGCERVLVAWGVVLQRVVEPHLERGHPLGPHAVQPLLGRRAVPLGALLGRDLPAHRGVAVGHDIEAALQQDLLVDHFLDLLAGLKSGIDHTIGLQASIGIQ